MSKALDLTGIGEKRMTDEEFAGVVAQRLLTLFTADLPATKPQLEWAAARLFHLFLLQKESPKVKSTRTNFGAKKGAKHV